MLAELIRQGATKAVVGILCDPEAAEAAHRAGEGGKITVALGGKYGPAGVKPYDGEFFVTRLGDGVMVSTGSTIRGRKLELGKMALLTIGGVSVVVSSKRMQAYDPGLFRHVGVEPEGSKNSRAQERGSFPR